jgi:hypothetical protein
MYMSVWNHPLLDLMTIDPAHSTDTSYEYLPGYPMPGINGMLGVAFVF